MIPKSIEIFSVKVISKRTENRVDMMLLYINANPDQQEEYQLLAQEKGEKGVEERLRSLIADHFGVIDKKREL